MVVINEANFYKTFSGNQPCQLIYRRFRDRLCSQHQGYDVTV